MKKLLIFTAFLLIGSIIAPSTSTKRFNISSADSSIMKAIEDAISKTEAEYHQAAACRQQISGINPYEPFTMKSIGNILYPKPEIASEQISAPYEAAQLGEKLAFLKMLRATTYEEMRQDKITRSLQEIAALEQNQTSPRISTSASPVDTNPATPGKPRRVTFSPTAYLPTDETKSSRETPIPLSALIWRGPLA